MNVEQVEAEIGRLIAESRRINDRPWYHPFVAAAGVMGAGAGLVIAVQYVFDLLQ